MPMFVAGVDGCRAPEGWVWFKVEVSPLDTSVELVELPRLLRSRPSDLAFLAIDIPIGLLDGSRARDKAARKLLGQPLGTSVFAAPCRAALTAKTHVEASAINRQKTGRELSEQAFGIGRKIKQVDDAMTPDRQTALGIFVQPRWRQRISLGEPPHRAGLKVCRPPSVRDKTNRARPPNIPRLRASA